MLRHLICHLWWAPDWWPNSYPLISPNNFQHLYSIGVLPCNSSIVQLSQSGTLWLFNIAMENKPFIDDKHDDLAIKNDDIPVRYVK